MKIVVGLLLVAIAAAGLGARGRLGEALLREGAPAAQRPLAGGTAGANPAVSAPVRVILVDGLGRAGAGAMPALDALCADGLELVVDVGFPTKSLPVQQVLWSGLTNQQLGARGDNLASLPPPSSVPALVPGSLAVVESHPSIAESVGFTTVVDRSLGATATAAVAGEAPLAMIHVLAVDAAAHGDGPGSAAHRDALAFADRAVAELTRAAPAAQWLVISDHGHVAGGGHGDAEPEVRRVRACWSPAPAGVVAPPGAEVHLIDVSRWIADALGAPRHARAQGRALAVAAAHPDRDATLPRPGAGRTALALLVLAAGVALGLVASRGRMTALWPLGAALVIALVHGVPTLSHRAPAPLLLVTGALLSCVVMAVERRATPARRVFTSLGCIAGAVVALLVVTGLPQALLDGPAPRVPGWTGLLVAAAPVLAGAILATGTFLALEGLLGRLRE